VISVLGLGGIGKSALVVSLMHQLAEHFEVVIWRSLRDAPTCETFLDNCIKVIAPQPLGSFQPASNIASSSCWSTWRASVCSW